MTFVHNGRVVHDRSTGVFDEALYAKALGARYVFGGRPPRSAGAASDASWPESREERYRACRSEGNSC